ncbi:MAG: C-terminal target protein, partial [Flaviaesturariibacter sp.]|nr:C-terminal target protein [Flaviaesturariibacter sp.]
TSAIVLLRNSVATGFSITTLYPNPAKNTIKLSLESAVSGTVQLTISDMNGRAVRSESRALSSGTNALELNITSLSSGTYTIKVKNTLSSESVIATFIKS